MRKTHALVLDYIIKYKTLHDGNSPTLTEIGNAVGISSKSVVRDRIKWLQAAGYLKEVDGSFGQGRVIEVVGGRWSYDKQLGKHVDTGSDSHSGLAADDLGG